MSHPAPSPIGVWVRMLADDGAEDEQASKRELDRAETLQRVCDCRLSVTDAAVAMNVTRRHATRLLAAYRSNGSAGLMSKWSADMRHLEMAVETIIFRVNR